MRESTQRAASAWLANELVASKPDERVDRLAAALEDHARAWAKELNLAWDRRGEIHPEEQGPGVPVLQPNWDETVGRLGRAEELLVDLREVATTADEERQGEILRKWGLRGRAYTPQGVLEALFKTLVSQHGAVLEIAQCDICAGTGELQESEGECLDLGGAGYFDCQACDGTGRTPAGRA